LASQALTVEHASHGRLDLGLGAAWAREEHDELGIDFPPTGQRFDLLEDTLEIVTRLYTGERVSYDGRRLSLRNAQMRPVPVQSPRPPIWIGGSGPKRTLPLVARYADMWHTYLGPDYGELSARVAELARQEGRDPADIGRAGFLSLSEPWPVVRSAIERNLDFGIGYLVCGWPSEGADRVIEFAEAVAPDY
jgi:alkanesulfonate monooxygenase SsuD/methylene tetrahydromethanopterin reductase-like flavin-dependent oxidoreductase (luciferase family)